MSSAHRCSCKTGQRSAFVDDVHRISPDTRPVLLFPVCSKLPEERVAPNTGEKSALRNDDHALLAAREHDVHSVQKPQESSLVGAHD